MSFGNTRVTRIAPHDFHAFSLRRTECVMLFFFCCCRNRRAASLPAVGYGAMWTYVCRSSHHFRYFHPKIFGHKTVEIATPRGPHA